MVGFVLPFDESGISDDEWIDFRETSVDSESDSFVSEKRNKNVL